MMPIDQLRRGILQKMIELSSVYGEAARMCINSPALEEKFLHECYNEIKENRKAMQKYLGDDVVERIVLFVGESKDN